MRIGFGLALIAAGALVTAAAPATGPQITIASGTLRGVETDGVDSFRGIPFAAPPVGSLRWRAPQPVAPWKGVRDAIEYSHDCMQVRAAGDGARPEVAPAEDCLYANVWKPTGAHGKLPVLVWIYGGAFVIGGASSPITSGAELAKQGILVVSFNYRLGHFGTFAHPQLTRQNRDRGLLGNYWEMDQIAALKWVQRNIAAFGGDPRNVTIVGESAGGVAIHNLITSPLTNGLFSKAVIQSGADGKEMVAGATLKSSEAAGVAFGKSKGIAADDPRALEKLRALSADDVTGGLTVATMGANRATMATPFIDGTLSLDVPSAYAAGRFDHVPMMIGATNNDYGGRTGKMVRGARDIAGAVAAKGLPVYEYRFSYVAESARGPGDMGATHGSDIPYFFDTVAIRYGDKTSAADRAMGHLVSAYLVNFLKTGDPNGAGLAHWQRYAKASDAMIDFSARGSAVPGHDPLAAELDAGAGSH